MSGIGLELMHIFDSLSECVQCLPRPSSPVRAGLTYTYAEPDPAEHGDFTIRSSVRINSDYRSLPQYDPGNYLDACGQRVLDVMSASTTSSSGSFKDKSRLNLDILFAMTPIVNERDLVKMAARHLFLSHVKSQQNVKSVFFPEHKGEQRYANDVDYGWFDFAHFACLFVCQAICKVKDEYQMHSLLDEHKIDAELTGLYTSPHWKKIGFALYTVIFKDLVKDEVTKIPFSAFLEDDRQGWARRMSDRVREKQWVYANLIQPVVLGQLTDEQYNRDLNILFIKLHLLDPSTVMPTFDYVRKALPDLNLELVTTNYLGDPLDLSHIKEDVVSALKRPTYPTKSHRLSLNELEVFYGLEVLEFIMNEAKERGLWTGKEPDNKRISQLRDRCVVM